MSTVVRKKQDDKYLTALRELVNTGGGNRQCFDCGQKGPTYVNMTIGSFVCTRCSGVLRGITPPHRVKSISMATFTQEEIDFLKSHGNDACAKTWLGLWDPKRAIHQDHRELMIDKYERKRYYLEPASPLKSLTNAASLKATSAQSSNHTSNNNHTSLTNGHKALNGNSNLDNGFSNIQLTPPTSQRTTANGLHHKSSSSAISRPHQPQQNGGGGGGSFSHHQDAFMINNGNGNGFNGFSTSAGSTSTGALSDTSSCASNGFGPEADFVADFGSANIFDATSASSVGSPAVSSASSVASSNGYAKIQPIKAAHQQQQQQQQQQFMNGHVNGHLNGTSSRNGNNENFADFDHAPIYNAAANYQFISKSHLSKTAQQQMQQPKRQQQQQQRQHQQQQQLPTTASMTSQKTNNSFIANDFDFIGGDHDNEDDVVGTLAAIIGSGNNRNNRPRKSTNIIYSESTSNFNDPFADFSTVINNKNNNNNNNSNSNSSNNKNKNNNNKTTKFVSFESDFDVVAQQQKPQQQMNTFTATTNSLSAAKFTPLAMAAHATAMAVLGSDYHFNKSNNYNNNNNNNSNSNNNTTNDNNFSNKFNAYRNPFDAEQWDVWQETPLDEAFQNNQNQNAVNKPIWPPVVPFNSDNYNNNNPINTEETNNNNYIALSELTTSSYPTDEGATATNPVLSSTSSNWFESNNYRYAETPKPRTTATTTTNLNGIVSGANINQTSSQTSPQSAIPIPNGNHKNSMSASNNNKLSSTPSEDRYAALKDLDEQLRERKAVAAAAASVVASSVVDSFGNNNNNLTIPNASNINPFKSQQQNPFQMGTPNNASQHLQQQNLYGQLTVIPNGISGTAPATNGFGAQQQTPPQPTAFFNYSNGYTSASLQGGMSTGQAAFPPMTGGPNGCGFGFGAMQQQISATGVGAVNGVGGVGAYVNPFAATGAMNTNNPFL